MSRCPVPPSGWVCSRPAGHGGPCAAYPAADAPLTEAELVAIAVASAIISPERHSYMPVGAKEAVTFQPHDWVLDAMRVVMLKTSDSVKRHG